MVIEFNESQFNLRRFCEWCFRRAQHSEINNGQFIFDLLPPEVQDIVRTTYFDPFYANFTIEEMRQWFNDHLVFNEQGEVIVLFFNRHILWERDFNG